MSAVSGTIGAIMGKKGSDRAADAQEYSADRMADITWDMYQQSRDDTQGQRDLFDFFEGDFKRYARTPDYAPDLENDPIYRQQKQDALKTINERMAAEGKYNSSDADNAIVRNLLPFMQDARTRKMQEDQIGYGRVLDAMKIGSGAATAAGQNAMIAGSNMSDAYRYGGDAAAQGHLAGANYMTQAAGMMGDTNAYIGSNLLSNWMGSQQAAPVQTYTPAVNNSWANYAGMGGGGGGGNAWANWVI